tara:strand:+ start:83 stop:550 length:468 start_codon:yes stop_codon:yes gene_type:complete
MKDFNLKKYLAENKLLKEYMDLEIDEEFIVLTSDSGEYHGDLSNYGTVSFSVYGYEEEREDGEIDFDEDNWEDILGPNHAFSIISDKIPTKVEAAGDYVAIEVEVEDLKRIADDVVDTKSDDSLDSPAAGNIEATYSKPGGPVFKSYSDFQDYYK